MASEREDLVHRITDYLGGGGLFNPELAHHDAVRDLLIDCRSALALPKEEAGTCQHPHPTTSPHPPWGRACPACGATWREDGQGWHGGTGNLGGGR